jgi:hypothetical protein
MAHRLASVHLSLLTSVCSHLAYSSPATLLPTVLEQC